MQDIDDDGDSDDDAGGGDEEDDGVKACVHACVYFQINIKNHIFICAKEGYCQY